jgi:hypothetical protein
MAFPTPATKNNCDASTDDPKQALLTDLAQLVDKFNQLLGSAAAAGPLSASGITGAAPLASPALTGTPTAPTPAQFDNDTSIAIIAFVQGIGLHTPGLAGYTASATLGTADIGRTLYANNAGPVTLTLPDGVALALPAGSMIIAACLNAGALTLQRAGTAVIYAYGIQAATTLTLQKGDGVELAWDGGNWVQVGGTARFSGDSTRTYSVAAGVAATDAVNVGQFTTGQVKTTTAGNQPLPGGVIIKSGYIAGVAPGALVTVTFPVAFPNGIEFATNIPTILNNVAQTSPTASSAGAASFQFTNATGITNNFYWFAIGY